MKSLGQGLPVLDVDGNNLQLVRHYPQIVVIHIDIAYGVPLHRGYLRKTAQFSSREGDSPLA